MTRSIRTARSKRLQSGRTVQRKPLDKAKGTEIDWDRVPMTFQLGEDILGVSYVYCVGEGADGPVKIGTAKDPIARLRQMQTGNSRPLKIEHLILGDSEVERLLHEIWRDDRLTGEWFRPEVRERLYPVMSTARLRQISYVNRVASDIPDSDDTVRVEQLCECVKVAHTENDVVMRIAYRPRLLAAGGGYIVSGGRSRIEEKPAA